MAYFLALRRRVIFSRNTEKNALVWSGKITPSICPEQGTMDYYQVLVHDYRATPLYDKLGLSKTRVLQSRATIYRFQASRMALFIV